MTDKEMIERMYDTDAYREFVNEMNAMVQELSGDDEASVMVDIEINEL